MPVGAEHVAQAVQRSEAGVGAVGRLGQQQVGDRADEDGPRRLLAGPQRLQDLGGRAIGRIDGPETGDVVDGGGDVELGDEVVVVGVEPLGHLQGGALPLASGGCEEARQGGARVAVGSGAVSPRGAVIGPRGAVGPGRAVVGAAAQIGEAPRQGAEGRGDLEDLVVVGEVRGDGGGAGQTQPAQARAGGGAQVGGTPAQPGDVKIALPVRLDGALELAIGADTGVAENRGGGQGAGGHGHECLFLGVRQRRCGTTASVVRAYVLIGSGADPAQSLDAPGIRPLGPRSPPGVALR